MTAEAQKNWGTIFMGTEREVNFDQLSSVAPSMGGVWKRDQEDIYLERVQRRAKEQARAILVRAGRERAALLEEAHSEIVRIRAEAEQQAAALRAASQTLKAEAAQLHEEARLLHAGAEAAGYAAGVGQAQAELEHFRAVMGESVGAVLSAVHAQCDRIFEIWKEDLCALLLACVEKGTALVLDKDRVLLLEQLLLGSVKLFEAHSSVLVRVRPDDEAAVADMFAAAKERIPGLGAWSVQGDPDLAPGDLVLEAAHSRVESRIAERGNAVDAALRHLMLPAAAAEENGHAVLARVNAEAVARMLELAPKRPFAPHGGAASADGDMSHPEAEEAAPATEDAMYAAERAGPPDGGEEICAEARAPELPAAPQVDLSQVWNRPEAASSAVLNVTDATDAVDAVLAEGGFLPGTGEA